MKFKTEEVSLIIGKTETKTCRNNCFFFDIISQRCGIFDGVKIDSPETVVRCQQFSDCRDFEEAVLESSFPTEVDNQDFSFEIMGDYFNEKTSTYPIEPDLQSKRGDAIWFVSPDKSFGCWIINEYQSRFFSINSTRKVEIGWMSNIYRSPYPLHNHASSVSLSSRMCWYIDKDGWGQYVLLVNEDIKMISAPKPWDWNRNNQL